MEGLPAAESRGASLMLLSSVSCSLAAIYLVHYPGVEVQRRAWRLIGSSVSAFSAALLVGAATGAMDEFLLPGLPAWVRPTLIALWAAFCYELLQLTLAAASGALSPGSAGEAPSAEAVESNKRGAVSFLGHVTGLSAVAALDAAIAIGVGHGAPRWIAALALMPAAAAALWMVFRTNEAVREKAMAPAAGERCTAAALVWDDGARAAEELVAILAMSFLLARAASAAVDGGEPGLSGATWTLQPRGAGAGSLRRAASAALLLGAALAFSTASAAAGWMAQSGGRKWAFCEAVAAAAAAWGALDSLQRLRACNVFWAERGCLLGVDLALMGMAVAFGAVLVLGHSAPTARFAAEEALGLLLGLAWAAACELAAATVASQITFAPGAASEQLLVVAVCAMVVPAWRVALLPKELLLEAEGVRSQLGQSASKLPPGEYVPLAGDDAGGSPAACRQSNSVRSIGKETEHERKEQTLLSVRRASLLRGLQQAEEAMATLKAALGADDSQASVPAAAAAAATAPLAKLTMSPVVSSVGSRESGSDKQPLLKTVKRLSAAHNAIKKEIQERESQVCWLQKTLASEEQHMADIEASILQARAEALGQLGQLRARAASAAASEPAACKPPAPTARPPARPPEIHTYNLSQAPHAGVVVHTFPLAASPRAEAALSEAAASPRVEATLSEAEAERMRASEERVSRLQEKVKTLSESAAELGNRGLH